MSQQQQQQQQFAHGPGFSLEYLTTLTSAQQTTTGHLHQQLRQLRHQSALHSATPHYHARQAAQVARTRAQSTNNTIPSSQSSSSSSQSLEEISQSDGVSPRLSQQAPVTRRPVTIMDPTDRRVLSMGGGEDGKLVVAQRARSATQAASNNNNSTQTTTNATTTDNPTVQHQQMAEKASPLNWSILDLGGTAIHTISSSSTLFTTYSFLTAIYLNHNQLDYVPTAIKQLKSLLVLDLSYNRIRYLPAEMGDLRSLKELWVYDNLLETVPWQMAYLKNLEFFGIDGNPMTKPNPYLTQLDQLTAPVQDMLKSVRYENPAMEVLHRGGPQGLAAWLRDQMPPEVMVPFAVPKRRWIRRVKAENTDEQRRTTILSYNILCEKYATQQQYWYTPAWALSWTYRRDRILQEILELSADVLCLQEVDYTHYEEWWYPKLCGGTPSDPKPSESLLAIAGLTPYVGTYLAKSRFKTMSDKMKRAGVDGCATFWKRDSYKQVGQPLTIEFSQLALSRPDFVKNDTMFERFCSKDNISLGVVLESTTAAVDELSRRMLVVNVHLHWDPMQTDVKLVQSVMLMEEIERFSKQFLRENGGDKNAVSLPTVICGDFNSLPKSLVCDFFGSSGGIKDVASHPDLIHCFTPTPILKPTMQDGSALGTPDVMLGQKLSNGSGANLAEIEDEGNGRQESSGDSHSLKLWRSWKESGYGDISKSQTLKHVFSGGLASAYKSVEKVPVEDENVYVPPANVTSQTFDAESKRRPPLYPVPALPFTNHTANFTGVIDYIWHTVDDFEVDGVLGGYFLDQNLGRDVIRWVREGQNSDSVPIVPTTPISAANIHTDSLLLYNSTSPTQSFSMHSFSSGLSVWSVEGTRTCGFPNPVFPSDHIPVMCELVWRTKQEATEYSATRRSRQPTGDGNTRSSTTTSSIRRR